MRWRPRSRVPQPCRPTSAATTRHAPFGAGLHANATRCASWAPSSLRGCAWRDGRGRSAASNRSSTHRLRTRSTVERLTSRTSAMALSLKRGPASPSPARRACPRLGTRSRLIQPAADLPRQQLPVLSTTADPMFQYGRLRLAPSSPRSVATDELTRSFWCLSARSLSIAGTALWLPANAASGRTLWTGHSPLAPCGFRPCIRGSGRTRG
jgi:hypothetical protein